MTTAWLATTCLVVSALMGLVTIGIVAHFCIREAPLRWRHWRQKRRTASAQASHGLNAQDLMLQRYETAIRARIVELSSMGAAPLATPTRAVDSERTAVQRPPKTEGSTP